MILYHFTFLKTDDPRGGFMRREDGSPIWAPGAEQTDYEGPPMPAPVGLTPEPGNGTGWGSCEIPGAPEVVWLTGDPRTVPCEDSHIFRVTVKIHSTDRKLISWPKWRNRRLGHLPWFSVAIPSSVRRLTQDWWGYAGTIPLSRIVNIELLLHQQVPWYDDADVDETGGLRRTGSTQRRFAGTG